MPSLAIERQYRRVVKRKISEHDAKGNKPGGEGQIPYDLTFNWNIINKRKKQTKYNQRH